MKLVSKYVEEDEENRGDIAIENSFNLLLLKGI